MEAVTAHTSRLRASSDRLRSPAVAALADGIRRAGPVAVLYVGLVLLLWLPFGPRNGMPYETAFPYNSETTSFWHGFFYYADPLRIYTNVFYNLGYHFSAWIGQGGSFIGYQIVYAALWWARGFLAYLIMRVLFPRHVVLAALTGILVLVQASDHALNWVGQLNQFGMIFWMMLAFYALVRALRSPSAAVAALATILAMLSAYMSLWSYESPLFMILAFPLIVLALRFGWSRRTLLITAAFYVVPLVYIWDNYVKYTTSGSSTYQESVVRSSLSPGPLLSDLWFNVESALKFTSWGSQVPAVTPGTERILLSLGGAVTAAIGIAVVGHGVLRRREPIMPGRQPLLYALAAGLSLLVLSFPAYLILTSARLLWRTQFLAGIGSAVVLAALTGLLALVARRRLLQLAITALIAGAVSYFGVYASFTMASFHYSIWQRHRTAMAEVLAFAPRLEPGSLVVLTGVPKSADPFGDNMWFDVALRLAYPHDPVTGIYFYEDGSPAPHENMALRGGQWVFDGTGFPTLLQHAPFGNTVIVKYSPSGRGHLDENVPAFLNRRDPGVGGAYRPFARIEEDPVPAPVRRRYGPIPLPQP